MSFLRSSNPLSDLAHTINYSYSNTRVMAWKSFLLKDEDMKALASAKHLEEYIGLLEHTTYKLEMSKITKTDINALEDLLMANYIRLGELSRRISPTKTREFFDALLSVYEVYLIKRILNKFEGGADGKSLSIDYSVYMPVISENIKKFLKEVADAKTKTDVVDLLRDTKYRFLANMPAEEIRIPGHASSLLDRYYLHTLWDSVASLSSKDASCVRSVIGSEIDTSNIMVLMRAKQGRYKADRFLIPVSNRLGDKIRPLVGKDVREIVSGLSDTPYGQMLSEAEKTYEKTGSLLCFETAFRRYLLGEYRKTFKRSMFSIGVIVGFLKLKEYELMNLRSIAVSLDNGSDPKDIMELVIV
jgi:V/A-type H+-transporting ATPase subunit C